MPAPATVALGSAGAVLALVGGFLTGTALSPATGSPAPAAASPAPRTPQSPAPAPVPATSGLSRQEAAPDKPAPLQTVPAVSISSVSPARGTYGTAMVITVRFTSPVPKSMRANVTRLLTVTSSRSQGAAGWAWLDGSTVMYRPKTFWPGHTRVTLRADLDGKPLAMRIDDQQRTLITGKGRTTRTWSTGRSQVITVNSATHQATVVRDGKKVRTMGVSLGQPGWETRSGVKALAEAYKVKRMTSAAIGASDYYDLQVPYAIRLTPTGEFMHAAPWAAARIGQWNGSHGCTNLHLDDARWLYQNYLVYDPVVTTGTGRKMETWNGLGGPWNYTWKTWSSGDL